MKNNRIYLSPPHMGVTEKNLLIDAFDSNWIAPLGPHVDAFEREIAEYLDASGTCALSSGTAALHLALVIAGITAGDIVLCSSLTFAASANVIMYNNAIPVFLDVNPDTWTLDTKILEVALNRYSPKALIAVDLYGQSADYDTIIELCNKNNVIVIEDAAESLGAEYKEKKCGAFGRMSALSFNGNKIITTSGGGMLVSNNTKLIEKARFLATQAREDKIHYEHKVLGYNYRMSNLLAAVGRGQLQVLDDRVKALRKIYQRYFDALSNIDGIEFMPEAPYNKATHWLTVLTVDEQETGINCNEIIEMLEKENIEARPVWKPMHLQPLYHNMRYLKSNSNDVSGRLFRNGLCLPSGSNLSVEDQNRIIDILITALLNK